jgi:methionyl-tRNA formyltransferase
MKIFAVDVVSPELSQEYMELPVGAVVTDGKSRMWVRAANQFVSILEIQAPGKKRLPIGGFLAGFRGEQCYFE